MSALLERENLPADKAVLADETIPECLRADRPFVLLWADEQKSEHETSLGFSGGSRGMRAVDVDISGSGVHDHIYPTRDDSGMTFVDSSLT